MMLHITTELQRKNFSAQVNEISKLIQQMKLDQVGNQFLTAAQLEKLAEEFPNNNTLTMQIKNAEIAAAINIKLLLDKAAFINFLHALKEERIEKFQVLEKIRQAYKKFLDDTIHMNNMLTSGEINKFKEMQNLLVKSIEDLQLKVKILDIQISKLDLIIAEEEKSISHDKQLLAEVVQKIYSSDENDFSFTMSLVGLDDRSEKTFFVEQEDLSKFRISLNKIKDYVRLGIQNIRNEININSSTFNTFEEQQIKKGIEIQLKEHYHFLPSSRREQLVKMNMETLHCDNVVKEIKTKIYSDINKFSLYKAKDEIIERIDNKSTELSKKVELRNKLFQMKLLMESGIKHMEAMMKIAHSAGKEIPNIPPEKAAKYLDALNKYAIFYSSQKLEQNGEMNNPNDANFLDDSLKNKKPNVPPQSGNNSEPDRDNQNDDPEPNNPRNY